MKEYYLIVDDKGLDQMNYADDARIAAMELRMRYNSHRNPKGYRISLSDLDFAKVKGAHNAGRLRSREATLTILQSLDSVKLPQITTLDF